MSKIAWNKHGGYKEGWLYRPIEQIDQGKMSSHRKVDFSQLASKIRNQQIVCIETKFF